MLGDQAKAALAADLTSMHSEYAGVPKSWVHVVFEDYAIVAALPPVEPHPGSEL